MNEKTNRNFERMKFGDRCNAIENCTSSSGILSILDQYNRVKLNISYENYQKDELIQM